jgi:hypothetical protein
VILPSPEISHRDEFALLCNWRKLWGVAVEIGVDQAIFAERFLNEWHGELWLGVDPYEPYPETPWDREADYHAALLRLQQFGNRARLIRERWSGAYAAIGLGRPWNRKIRPCFGYVDGSHEFAEVRTNIDDLWSTIDPGGIFAGHDYDETHPGVMQAVNEFAECEKVDVFLTREPLPSWYCYKRGMPGPEWKRCP